MTGALAKSDGWRWLTYECGLCGNMASSPTPTALDKLGRPLVGLTGIRTDTGKHMLLCETCVEDVAEAHKTGDWSALDEDLGITLEMVEASATIFKGLGRTLGL